MNEVILISDHPMNERRMEKLFSLVKFLKKNNKKICLTSHILIPEYIQKKCDFFLYDKENDLNTITFDENTLSQDLYCLNYVFSSPEFLIPFKDRDYRYSCISQVLLSLSFLKNKGFDVIHYIEGDVTIDINEINNNFDIINHGEFDSVIYSSEVCMCGGFFSLSTKKLNLENLLPLNKNQISKDINKFFLLENYTKNIVLGNHRKHVKNFDDYPFLWNHSVIDNEDEIKLKHSFFELEEKKRFLIWNDSKLNVSIKLMSSIENLNSNFTLNSGMTKIFDVHETKDGDFLNIFVNNIFYKNYTLSKKMEEFKYNKMKFNNI